MTDQNAYAQLIPAWAAVAARLPATGRHAAAALVGSYWLLRGLVPRNRCSALVSAIGLACGVNRPRAMWILFLTLVHNAENAIYFAALERLSDEALAAWAERHKELRNIEVLNQSKANGPVILLLVSFSLHYFGPMQPLHRSRGDAAAIRVVQPSAALTPLNRIGYYERLSRVFGRSIEGIFADSPTVAIHVVRAANRGAVVAMRVDSLPTQTLQFVETKLCGRPSMFPLSILQLAAHLGADLIPFSVVRRNGRFVTELHQPVRLPRGASPDDYMQAAAVLDEQTGALLRAHPEQYTAWPAVLEKWRMAAEVQAFSAEA